MEQRINNKTHILKNEITAFMSNTSIVENNLLEVLIKYNIIDFESITEKNGKIDLKKISTSKHIYYLKEEYDKMLFNININEDIKYYIQTYEEKKLDELLEIFNLTNDILWKNYIELSSSEYIKILLIIGLLSDAKTMIIYNPTLYLDNNSIQSLIKCFKRKKRETKIIIISNNVEFLLQIAEKIIVIKNNKVLLIGDKYEILSNEKILSKINLSFPNILKFVNLAKSKNIKIGYRDNINDLIKDVFRNAK